MRIENLEIAAVGCILVGATVGILGAYIVKPLFNSPLGIALSCALTTGIVFAVLSSEFVISLKFIGLLAAYPLGVIITNLLKFNVRFIDPMVAATVGTAVIIPVALTALVLSYACSIT